MATLSDRLRMISNLIGCRSGPVAHRPISAANGDTVVIRIHWPTSGSQRLKCHWLPLMHLSLSATDGGDDVYLVSFSTTATLFLPIPNPLPSAADAADARDAGADAGQCGDAR